MEIYCSDYKIQKSIARENSKRFKRFILEDILKNNSFRCVSRVMKFAEFKMPYRLSKVHRISKALENLTNSHQQYHFTIIQYVNYIISRTERNNIRFDKFHDIYQRFIQWYSREYVISSKIKFSRNTIPNLFNTSIWMLFKLTRPLSLLSSRIFPEIIQIFEQLIL